MSSSLTTSPNLKDPFVLVLVGVVCAFLVIITYYHRPSCCSRSRDPRQLQAVESLEAPPPIQFHSRGLDSYIMNSLSITLFKKNNEESLDQGNVECAVCLGEFEEGEWIKHLPYCSHVFHVACIDIWFQTHSTCPLCRSHIFDLRMRHEYSGSVCALLETLRREDFHQERLAHCLALGSHILQNSSRGTTS